LLIPHPSCLDLLSFPNNVPVPLFDMTEWSRDIVCLVYRVYSVGTVHYISIMNIVKKFSLGLTFVCFSFTSQTITSYYSFLFGCCSSCPNGLLFFSFLIIQIDSQSKTTEQKQRHLVLFSFILRLIIILFFVPFLALTGFVFLALMGFFL